MSCLHKELKKVYTINKREIKKCCRCGLAFNKKEDRLDQNSLC